MMSQKEGFFSQQKLGAHCSLIGAEVLNTLTCVCVCVWGGGGGVVLVFAYQAHN